MNKSTRFIFEDPYGMMLDLASGKFASLLKTRNTIVWQQIKYLHYVGVDYDPVLIIHDTIELFSKNGEMADYVILTTRPILYKDKFISNNVIDVSGRTIEQVANEVDWVFSGFGHNKRTGDEKTFFIADTHFFHKNIIKYCNRPWSSGVDESGSIVVTDDDVAKMNESMIDNWNSVVCDDDVVWMLGDFSFGSKDNVAKIRTKLNGKINLVMGNHDRHSVKFYYDAGFERVYDRSVIIMDYFVLSHAPMQFVKEPFVNVFGHVHDCDTFKTISKNGFCVCAERWNYTPVSLKTMKEKYFELFPEVDL